MKEYFNYFSVDFVYQSYKTICASQEPFFPSEELYFPNGMLQNDSVYEIVRAETTKSPIPKCLQETVQFWQSCDRKEAGLQ